MMARDTRRASACRELSTSGSYSSRVTASSAYRLGT
jgi:hypothetical protein